MKALIILSNPQSEASFCGAIASTAADVLKAAGAEVVVHDLYAENFDPNLTTEELKKSLDELDGSIRKSIDELFAADVLVFVHPNWWGMPPANLVGWISRVVRQGVCYRFTEKGPEGFLGGKKTFVFTTANTPADIEEKFNHDPIRNLWTNIIANTVNLDDVTYVNFTSIILSDDKQRKAWLEEVKTIVSNGVK